MAKTKATEEQPTPSENVEETQPTEEVKDETQPSIEDLQNQIASGKERYDDLMKESQRRASSVLEEKQKLGQRAEILDSLPEILDNLRLQQAESWDELQELKAQQLGGTDYQTQTYAPQQRVRRADEVKSQIEARKQIPQAKETETKVDPEELRASVLAQGVIEEMNWDMNHPSVKKTLHLDDPRKALEILRKEQKTQRDREVEETVQAKIKESGVTIPETAGPSGASLNDDAFIQSYSEGKSDDHARAKKILQMK